MKERNNEKQRNNKEIYKKKIKTIYNNENNKM